MFLTEKWNDLVLLFILAIYSSFVLAHFWVQPYLLTLLLLPAPIILSARLQNPKMAVIMFLSAAILGPLTETCCVLGGLWTYADTGGLPFVPIWNCVAWACFPPALWLGVKIFLKEDVPKTANLRSLALSLLGIGLMTALFIYSENQGGPTVILGSVMAIALVAITRNKATLLMMVMALVMGPIGESPAIASGAWHYAVAAQVMELPAYMIPAYAIFGALIARFSQTAWALSNDYSRAQIRKI